MYVSGITRKVGKMWIRIIKHVYILILVMAFTALIPVQSTPTVNNTGIEVYFMPVDGARAVKRITELIDRADNYVYLASFLITQKEIVDALISAARRGLDVRVVTDTDSMTEYQSIINNLEDNGVKVVFDKRMGDYMHDKFIVIDDRIVVTGSTNYRDRSFYHNTNDMIIIHSRGVAENYRDEFLEMFNGVFGGGARTLHPIQTVDDTIVETYFAPEDGVADKIIHYVSRANRTIYMAAYVFTNREIADSLVRVHVEKNVTVIVVYEEYYAEESQSMRYLLDYLEEHGIRVYGDVNPYTMHCKLLIIDSKIVVTGSYNPTYHAEYANDENIVVIHSKTIAGKYIWFYKNYILPNGTRIILHVVDEYGEPVEGAEVYAEELSKHLKYSTTTGPDGNATITIPGLRPGDRVKLYVKLGDLFSSSKITTVEIGLGPNYVVVSVERYNYRLIIFVAGIIVLLVVVKLIRIPKRLKPPFRASERNEAGS